jgi:hypothetical protein
MKTLIILFAVTLCLAEVAGSQSSADLSHKYRTVVFFEIRPGVVMAPQYTANGDVCQMAVQKLSETEQGNLADNFFSEHEIGDLVDELAPPVERGKEITLGLSNGHGPEGYMAGGMIERIMTYENVIVAAVGRSQLKPPARNTVLVFTWRNRVCQAPVQ